QAGRGSQLGRVRLRRAEPVYPAVNPTGPRLGGVTNIHPYSSDGRPLREVLLYDQDGNPLVLDGGTDAEGNPITVVPRYARDGGVVPNLYPQEQTVVDYSVVLGPDALPRRRAVTPPAVTPPTLTPR
ncbi:MAG TPA: hypothetical protein VE547_17805, partial [Mycobacteriales bacterium]|nr:hypothetical protein [Mycobacteriales bacterium]